MPEWLVERGIGEDRAILVENDMVLAAKIRWPGDLFAGERIEARLTAKAGARGTATLSDGREVLVDRLPRNAGEGATIPLLVTRAAIAERGRLKMPAARPPSEAAPVEDVFAGGRHVRRFPSGSWEDIWHAAAQGEIESAGGSLQFSVTPAMTLIDIDGDLPPHQLAVGAIPQIARWVRRFDLGGSIGIDFPTLPDRKDRKAVDELLDEALAGWPHERTAMNGFGFVQLVARLEGPSLLHRLTNSRLGAAARMALRRAEMVEGAGVTQLTIHPVLKPRLASEWLAELERRTGRPLRVATDPGLAIEAAAAQIVPHE
ncbi:MAG: ribonuclease [Qipengyuania sp.]